MDDRTERDERTSDPAVLELLGRWSHVPVLLVTMAFMFWVRVQSYDDFVYADEAVRLSAVDSWYHWRTTMYTVRNWPHTMPYDPWTAFPTGTYVGQFGTLFDQILATVALIVGLGSPGEWTVFRVVLLTVPAMAALVAIPTYYIGERLGGRIGGLTGVVLLALFPGTFLNRTTTGMLQHHVAEVLFMSIAILTTMVALRVAEREEPGYRHVVEREYGQLRRTIGYSALAGVAIALYIWVWPPGVVLVGILGLFFAIELSVTYGRGETPEHLAFVGAVALAVTGLLTSATMEVTEINPTDVGPLQPVLAFVVAGGCVFMAWLAREWKKRRIDERYYPAAIAGTAVVSMAAVALVLPDLWATIVGTVYGRLLPFGYSSTALTVQEVRPPDDVPRFVFRQYGAAFYTAMAGLAALAVRAFFADDRRAEHALIVVWALVLTSMAFTQIRFHYYYVVPVAVLNAYAVGRVVARAGLAGRWERREVDVGHALVLLAVVSVLLVPLLPPVASVTVVDAGGDESPSREAMRWKSTNEWFAEHSPPPGSWGGADNEDELEYYGTYEHPDDGDFAYPEGAYGVMSWWDYGHLVTVQAERIPHANPFQENAHSAAAYLTAGSEERGELVLDALPAAGSADPDRLDDDELAALADERTAQQEGEEIRYVVIGDEMAGGKFDDIATYADGDADAYREYRSVEVNEEASTVAGTVTVPVRNDAYADTVLSRLYYEDADGMDHYRLVHDDNQRSLFVSVAVSRDGGESWQPELVNRPLTPGIERSLSRLREDPDVEVAVYDVREEPAVKIYERVEGAELAGSVDAPAGATVTAELELTAKQFDRTFTYTQTATVEADGEFSMTVPYATVEDATVEEGYTDSDVIADGPYTISVDGEPVGTAEVAESAVYDGGTGDLSLYSTSSASPRNASSISPPAAVR